MSEMLNSVLAAARARVLEAKVKREPKEAEHLFLMKGLQALQNPESASTETESSLQHENDVGMVKGNNQATNPPEILSKDVIKEEMDEIAFCAVCAEPVYDTTAVCTASDCSARYNHLRCVGLSSPPARDSGWVCPACLLFERPSSKEGIIREPRFNLPERKGSHLIVQGSTAPASLIERRFSDSYTRRLLLTLGEEDSDGLMSPEREVLHGEQGISRLQSDSLPGGGHLQEDIQALIQVRTAIRACIESTAIGSGQKELHNVKPHLEEIRRQIHRVEFCSFLTPAILKESKVLEVDRGIPLIFSDTHKDVFPWDVIADTQALYMRWIKGDLEASLRRGLIPSEGDSSKSKKRMYFTLDANYAFKKSANVSGSNDLTNGAWWPMRMAAVRDGAHGAIVAGIAGRLGHGAYSIVIASHGYSDKDDGDSIKYCSTKSPTAEPTKGTCLMMEAQMKLSPIRVLRAVNKRSLYAPKAGIRYDGLYHITGRELLQPADATYRFTLERLSGQDPIRYQGVQIKPTHEELTELFKMKILDGRYPKGGERGGLK